MNNKIRRGSLLAAASTYAGCVDIDNYLTIVALEDGLTASLSVNDVEYSIDGNDNWTTLTAGTASPAINTGQTLSFRGTLTPATSKGVGTFKISKSCDLTGNCNSLLFGDDAKTNLSLSGKNYAFYKLFYNCTTIKNVSSNFLPATTLPEDCYYQMFYGCSSLTTAPELPATILKYRCYSYMFSGCTSLTTAPQLPVTTLAENCYAGMFYVCSSLTTAPELPATTLTDYCYQAMFNGCSKLTTAPQLPATTLAENCYAGMFNGCKSLTTAPALPATTLPTQCYQSMFYNCTSLTIAPELPAKTLAKNCYADMFEGCTSLTTAPALPATTLAHQCYYSMFSGTNVLPDCSNINFSSSTVVASGGLKGLFAGTKVTDSDLRSILPINSNGKYYLPCTTLTDSCYESMFKDCKSLITAPELPAKILKSKCYKFMFEGCTSLTTAPELPATTLVTSCYTQMFYRCSKLNYIKAMFTTTPSSSYTSYWVSGVASSGTFVKNKNATWNVTGIHGIPSGWTVEIYDPFTPQQCLSLSIEADDISGRESTTTVYYTATVKGLDENNNTITKTITGTDTVEVGQNTSTTNSVTKTVSYTYMGVTATTTITQGVYISSSYTVNLNSQWQLSTTVSSPSDITVPFDGIYESYSNKGVNSSGASMYININGYTNFKFYIRSYAESNYDYVMVSQLDKTLTYSSSYSDTTLVKAHTRGKQQSGTALSNYTLVEFTNIDGGSHRIQIIYRKDSSSHSGDDRGYVLIPRNQ